MKIYYIASFTKLWDEECIARAFEELDCEVIRREQNRTNDFYLKEIEELKPDFVMFAKLLIKGDGFDLIRKIRAMGIKTVSWTFDLYVGYVRENEIKTKPFWRADYVITTDGGHEKEFKKLGVNHYCIRQGIYEPQAILGYKKPIYDYDVVFVGTENRFYPFRQQMLSFLERNFNFLWIGRHNADSVRGMELNNVYASAKIVIGDSVPSPKYWSNRIYETMGRGGFLLFPETEGLKEEFGKHLCTFKQGNLNDLEKKIKYYLKNDIKRTKKQLEGLDFIRDNYTYKQRCQKILELVNGGTTE